ncbi:GNAT family N-acetyltransferase [Ktedonospora formicarum]|uniref:N-acetyltransferase domain-containing protein n=1 Tax=Ktedonospora formicarum TaxID=2778364 RepID=A0A8J3HV53_9CHLR|nr:GNAT family protein [Ktedonospora formicarum]GHO44627.1 hypothetical protein KSX_27900 [Ktedonospora formicarum]
MRFSFMPLSREGVLALFEWRYPEPYQVYNLGGEYMEEALAELTDQRSPYYAAYDEQGLLAGFINVGTSALVWDAGEPRVFIDGEHGTTALGLGLRPDLTGHGLGLSFVESALTFLRDQFSPRQIRLFVLAWNKRALRVYEQAGFQQIRAFTQVNRFGTSDFIEMCLNIEQER